MSFPRLAAKDFPLPGVPKIKPLGFFSCLRSDCQPSLGMLTVNALAAANRVIIPVQAEYLPAKGLEQLLQTVNKVKRQINPKLQIDGILLTMVDNRTNFAKEIAALLRETYGSKIKVFGTEIPHSVRAKEISAEGKSIFAHDPNGKVVFWFRRSPARTRRAAMSWLPVTGGTGPVSWPRKKPCLSLSETWTMMLPLSSWWTATYNVKACSPAKGPLLTR